MSFESVTKVINQQLIKEMDMTNAPIFRITKEGFGILNAIQLMKV